MQLTTNLYSSVICKTRLYFQQSGLRFISHIFSITYQCCLYTIEIIIAISYGKGSEVNIGVAYYCSVCSRFIADQAENPFLFREKFEHRTFKIRIALISKKKYLTYFIDFFYWFSNIFTCIWIYLIYFSNNFKKVVWIWSNDINSKIVFHDINIYIKYQMLCTLINVLL